MKAKFLSTFAALALAAVAFSSCSDDGYKPDTQDKGSLNTATIIPEVANAEIIISDQQGATHAMARRSYPLDDFIITVVNASGETVANWTYNAMPSLPDFPVGTYTINVASCEPVPAEWEKPYFLGSQTFEIKKGEITDVAPIVCRLANIAVSVKFDDDLIAASAGDISVTVTSVDSHSLTFNPAETRRGYFQVLDGLATLEVHFTGTVNGVAEDFRYPLRDIAAGQHRKVSFALRTNPAIPPEEFGEITPGDGSGIGVSTTVTGNDLAGDTPWEETVIPGDDRPGKEEWPDEPNPGPGPGPEDPEDWKIEFTSTTLDTEGVNNSAGWSGDAVVDITSTNGFSSLLVEIISNSLNDSMLTEVGLAATFDLATGMSVGDNPRDLSAVLRDTFHFPVGEEVTGDGITSISFNITEFVPLLNIYTGEMHQFRITVTDKKGNKKDMTLKFQA